MFNLQDMIRILKANINRLKERKKNSYTAVWSKLDANAICSVLEGLAISNNSVVNVRR